MLCLGKERSRRRVAAARRRPRVDDHRRYPSGFGDAHRGGHRRVARARGGVFHKSCADGCLRAREEGDKNGRRGAPRAGGGGLWRRRPRGRGGGRGGGGGGSKKKKKTTREIPGRVPGRRRNRRGPRSSPTPPRARKSLLGRRRPRGGSARGRVPSRRRRTRTPPSAFDRRSREEGAQRPFAPKGAIGWSRCPETREEGCRRAGPRKTATDPNTR